ncbi:MAG: hypothetical protein WCP57_04955 [Bacteroidota bacterium]
MKKLLLVAYSIVQFGFIQAQNFSYDITLKQVSFSGTDYYSVKKDSSTGAYSTPQWKSSPSTSNPIAYKSGSYMNATATFELNCSNAPASVQVRGFGTDSFNFPVQTIAIPSTTTAPKTIIYPVINSTKMFEANKVKYYNYQINWEMSFDGGVHWYPAGTSTNKLYVTWHAIAPENAGRGYQWFHTLFELSCKSANNATSEDSIIAQTYREFQDNDVKTWDGSPLKYYERLYSPNSQTDELLYDHTGQCYCWAHLFIDVLKIQGIIKTNNYINIRAQSVSTSCGSIGSFLVKNWTFSTPTDSIACSDMPYKNYYDANFWSNDVYYPFSYTEVSDQTGIIGQTAPNPASYFSNHQICFINGKYFDPSYGLMYNTLSDIRAGIDGWSIRITSNESAESYDINGDSVFSPGVTVYKMRATRNVNASNFVQTVASY